MLGASFLWNEVDQGIPGLYVHLVMDIGWMDCTIFWEMYYAIHGLLTCLVKAKCFNILQSHGAFIRSAQVSVAHKLVRSALWYSLPIHLRYP
jgi:hypothetical protein